MSPVMFGPRKHTGSKTAPAAARASAAADQVPDLTDEVTSLSSDARLCLYVDRPDGSTFRYRPAGADVRIGSDPSCDLVLMGEGIGPLHARLELTESGLVLTDTSLTGTRVGLFVLRGDSRTLDPTEVIELGGHNLRVQMVVADEQPLTPAPAGTPATHAAARSRASARPAASGSSPAGSASLPASALAESPAVLKAEASRRGTREVPVAVRRRIHRELIEHLDLARLDRSRMNDHLLRAKVTHALQDIVERFRWEMPKNVDLERLIEELTHEAIGLGPLEELLEDPDVTEIMVVDSATIYIERARQMRLTPARFTDEESVRSILERIVAPLGRRIDESSPMLDARLPDGSRVNAIIRPLSLRGTCITIRKFAKKAFDMNDMVRFGTITARIARFLERTVAVRKNVLISGGTASGKTTLLNILSGSISAHERIVTIEDAAELRLVQPHVVPLEARPPNMEGKGQVTIRDLVKNAMRMRPDRIIVGECRGGEALDMLQAMNTGHSGSMTTTHANSPHEAMKRIETLALTAGVDVPARALREQIALAIHLIVQQERVSDGTRKITSVSEVVGIDEEGQIETREIFGFRRTGTGDDGTVEGEFYATGYLPSYVGEFITHRLVDVQSEVI
jgi:pilus assembly protein CpaF